MHVTFDSQYCSIMKPNKYQSNLWQNENKTKAFNSQPPRGGGGSSPYCPATATTARTSAWIEPILLNTINLDHKSDLLNLLDHVELALIQNIEKGEPSGRLKQHQHLQPSHCSTHLDRKNNPKGMNHLGSWRFD